MTSLVIAEKSKMAKSVASALGVPPVSGERGLYANDEYRIVSCEGHILEDYMPHDYHEELKKWSLETLPIRPEEWKLKISESKARYVKRISQEIKKVNKIIHLGDPDDEGQAIVDDVLRFLSWNGTTLRVLVNDLNPGPIRQAFQSPMSNELPKFRGMYRKALSRRHGDWFLGLNLTRLYTVLGRSIKLDSTLSAGRVQSAVLGLIVKRHLEIANFKPHDYYVVAGQAQAQAGSFKVHWAHTQGQKGIDDNGRLVDPAIAQLVISKSPLHCTVQDFETQRLLQSAPLPYSMSDLQKDCSKKLGLTMQEVMEIAQALYEKYGLITYPRTDTGYLPEDHHNNAKSVLQAIQQNTGLNAIQNADPSQKSKAFNDSKVVSHHGIIPTGKASSSTIASLTNNQKAVYQMVAERYTAQFLPPAVFDQTSVRLISECGEQFVTKGRVYQNLGWKELSPKDDQADSDDQDDSSAPEAVIPPMEIGDKVSVGSISASKKSTSAPKPYSDASLLGAMTGIHKHVTNKKVAALLKAGKGIGTDATRGTIVEKLVDHQLIIRKGKSIHPTDIGIKHYHLMPPEITDPDMAALFELKTQQVEQGQITKEQFLTMLEGFLKVQIQASDKWLENAKRINFQASRPTSAHACRNCEGALKPVKAKSSAAKLFVCRNCDSLYANESGNPGTCIKGPLRESDLKERQQRLNERLEAAPPCPVCQAPILKTKASAGKKPFWGCRTCNSAFADFGGSVGPMFVHKGERVESPADGPQCPDCKQSMHRRTTSKNKPILVCQSCDSMCWATKKGAGKWFKYQGEMVKD